MKIPLALKVYASLLLVAGAGSIYDGGRLIVRPNAHSITGRLLFDFLNAVFCVLLAAGLLRLRSGWRLTALTICWSTFVGTASMAVPLLVRPSGMSLSALFRIGGIFVLQFWVYHILRRNEVRAAFSFHPATRKFFAMLTLPPASKQSYAIIFRLNAILAGALALLLFTLSAAVYADKPSFSLKAVGYMFMAFYWLIFAAFVFGFGSFLALAASAPRQPMRLATLLALATACGAISSFMVLHHWHDLFRHQPAAPSQSRIIPMKCMLTSTERPQDSPMEYETPGTEFVVSELFRFQIRLSEIRPFTQIPSQLR